MYKSSDSGHFNWSTMEWLFRYTVITVNLWLYRGMVVHVSYLKTCEDR